MIAIAAGVYAASFHYAVFAAAGRAEPLVGAVTAGWLARWTWVVGFLPVVTFLPLLYPTGTVPSPRWRPLVYIAGGLTAGSAAILALDPAPPGGLSLPNPIGVAGVGVHLDTIGTVVGPLMLIAAALCLAAVGLRWVRADAEARRPLVGFGYAVAVTTLLSMFGWVLGPIAEWALAASVMLVAASIATAILRDHMFDIEFVIRRGVLFLAVGTGITAVYAVAVGTLGLLADDQGRAVQFGAAVVAAVVFQPLRGRVTRELDRLLYGERADVVGLLGRLGGRLRQARDPGEALTAAATVIRDGLRVPGVAIEVLDGETTVATAQIGELSTTPEMFVLSHDRETVGRLRIASRPGEAALEPLDRSVVSELEHQLALVAHAVRLSMDLQRSRERAVMAREEERRRMRGDLHDGLGPTLAGVAMSLDAAATLAERDPSTASELLRGARDELQNAVEDIRRLVYGLRPPALDDLGLAGALRASVLDLENAGPPTVTLDITGDLKGLPAAVEVAAYRIACEALSNVRRHAHGHTATLRIIHDGALDIEVTDDGVGVAADVRAGVGLASMRERATELGGSFSITKNPGGGTCLRARLPIPSQT